MRAEFCIFESNAPGLKANFYEPYVDKPTCTHTKVVILMVKFHLGKLRKTRVH